MRFYIEPSIELQIFPPAINIEFSALYLPENFSFDVRDLYNVTIATEKKLLVKANTINQVLEYFTPILRNFDDELSLVARHEKCIGILPLSADNFYGRQVQLWLEGYTSLLRFRAIAELNMPIGFSGFVREIIDFKAAGEEDATMNVYDYLEIKKTKAVFQAIEELDQKKLSGINN